MEAAERNEWPSHVRSIFECFLWSVGHKLTPLSPGQISKQIPILLILITALRFVWQFFKLTNLKARHFNIRMKCTRKNTERTKNWYWWLRHVASHCKRGGTRRGRERNEEKRRGEDGGQDKDKHTMTECQRVQQFPQNSFQKGNWRPRRTWNETHQFHAVSSRKPSLAAPSNRNYGFCLEGAGLHSATKKMRSQRERRPIQRERERKSVSGLASVWLQRDLEICAAHSLEIILIPPQRKELLMMFMLCLVE